MNATFCQQCPHSQTQAHQAPQRYSCNYNFPIHLILIAELTQSFSMKKFISSFLTTSLRSETCFRWEVLSSVSHDNSRFNWLSLSTTESSSNFNWFVTTSVSFSIFLHSHRGWDPYGRLSMWPHISLLEYPRAHIYLEAAVPANIHRYVAQCLHFS